MKLKKTIGVIALALFFCDFHALASVVVAPAETLVCQVPIVVVGEIESVGDQPFEIPALAAPKKGEAGYCDPEKKFPCYSQNRSWVQTTYYLPTILKIKRILKGKLEGQTSIPVAFEIVDPKNKSSGAEWYRPRKGDKGIWAFTVRDHIRAERAGKVLAASTYWHPIIGEFGPISINREGELAKILSTDGCSNFKN